MVQGYRSKKISFVIILVKFINSPILPNKSSPIIFHFTVLIKYTCHGMVSAKSAYEFVLGVSNTVLNQLSSFISSSSFHSGPHCICVVIPSCKVHHLLGVQAVIISFSPNPLQFSLFVQKGGHYNSIKNKELPTLPLHASCT